jgi:hypothetical protein
MTPKTDGQAVLGLGDRFRRLQILAPSVADSCEFMGSPAWVLFVAIRALLFGTHWDFMISFCAFFSV